MLKKRLLAILILILIWLIPFTIYYFIHCGDRFINGHGVRIVQNVDFDSRIDCTYTVRSYLVYGIKYNIEKSFYEDGVKKEDIEYVKEIQFDALLPYRDKLKLALKTECP